MSTNSKFLTAGFRKGAIFTLVLICLNGCAGEVPGPDKQGGGSISGAVTGAGAGAVTGFHVGVGTGPGALVGAGVGAVAGGIRGFAQDQIEENLLQLSSQTREQRQVSQAQEIIAEHFKRRAELHPTRDIYPADLFFYGDEAKLRPGADVLIREIARMNKRRLPWTRLAVTSYAKGLSEDESYAQQLAENRAREITNYLVRSGLQPRRLIARGMAINAPVLIDPDDAPERYNQAIEFVPLDR